MVSEFSEEVVPFAVELSQSLVSRFQFAIVTVRMLIEREMI